MAARFGSTSPIALGLEIDSVEGGEDALVVTTRSNALNNAGADIGFCFQAV